MTIWTPDKSKKYFISDTRAVGSPAAKPRTLVLEPLEHIAFTTSTGLLYSIQVAEYIELGILNGNPIPGSFLNGVEIEQYMIAPAYKKGLIKVYGKQQADKIMNKLVRFFELASLFERDPELMSFDDELDLDLGD